MARITCVHGQIKASVGPNVWVKMPPGLQDQIKASVGPDYLYQNSPGIQGQIKASMSQDVWVKMNPLTTRHVPVLTVL